MDMVPPSWSRCRDPAEEMPFEKDGRIVTSLLFSFPSLSPLKYSLGKTKNRNETLSGLPPAGGLEVVWDPQSHAVWRRS